MNPSGIFLSFEGIDGAGKTTHVDALAQALREQGHTVLRTREPGGTPLAEALRELVLHQPMDALTESLLVFAARRDHVQTVIRPALARGELVLCDRFTDASFAYQGGGRGFDLAILARLEQWVQGDPQATDAPVLQPDLTVWFDLPPEVAAARLDGARRPDRFEQQAVDFFVRVREGYHQRQCAAPGRFVRIDAGQPREQVWHDVCVAARDRGWLT